MVWPNYSVSSDTASGSVRPSLLHFELSELSLGSAVFQGLKVEADNIEVVTDVTPDGTDQTAITNAVAAHDGSPGIKVAFVESTEFIDLDRAINQATNWEELGGLVTNANSVLLSSGFSGDMNRAVGRVVMQVKSDDVGGEVKIVEVDDNGNETDLNTTPAAIPDTGGVWKTFKFSTDVAPAIGDRLFKLVGRRNSAPSIDIRYASMTLLDVGL